MLKHTKIVATASDQRCGTTFVETLYKAGMNAVRLNTTHIMEKGLARVINNICTVSDRIGILMGTKGPEVRTTTTVNKGPIPFKTERIVKVTGSPDQETSHDYICVSYKNFVNDLAVGSDIPTDNGDLEMKIIGKSGDRLLCKIQNDATLGSRKSVSVPDVRINLPSLTEKDRNNILQTIDHDLDFIAHSFVRSKQDILDIQRILGERNNPIKIIAKIENRGGVDNIEKILEVAYGVMIACGDLDIKVPAEKIPGIQHMLIHRYVEMKEPVIVATRMLHSMIDNPHPIRAKVMDIASAIYYRMDALTLSGETACEKYPIEAVRTITKVIREAEKTELPANDIRVSIEGNDLDVASFLAKQVVKPSSKLHVKAIITDSYTGRTARYLTAFRGAFTVFAICYNPHVMRMLGFSYGVWAVHQPYDDSRKEYFYDALNQLIHNGRITRNDMAAYLSDSFGKGGGTSFLEISNVGKVLDAGMQYWLPTFKE